MLLLQNVNCILIYYGLFASALWYFKFNEFFRKISTIFVAKRVSNKYGKIIMYK